MDLHLIPAGASVEKVAGGFQFTEGPVWVREPGYLLFSDIPANTIYKWSPGDGVSMFRKPSGYDGPPAPAGALVGSNGLTLDPQGRLVICEHGNRRVTRLEENGTLTVLADHFEGKRLNSPNDLVYRSDGALYFTDPPYGLPGREKDPQRELSFNGIYCLAGGELRLVHKEMTRPNGLAFSPDEKFLYVSNSDAARRVWMRFEVADDGGLRGGTLFYDVTAEKAQGSPDGLKVDRAGNIFCAGPGGIWIFSPAGKHLGTIRTPETPANCHWGDAGGKTLYITARTSVYRIRLLATGIRP